MSEKDAAKPAECVIYTTPLNIDEPYPYSGDLASVAAKAQWYRDNLPKNITVFPEVKNWP